MAHILIVEDDRDLNNAYSAILEHEGHTVLSVYNGQQALDASKHFHPELILLDLLMPVMGGLEFLEHYKRRKDVKVLIFTNVENSPEVTQAYSLGADRCVIKSWTAPHALARVVTETLPAQA